MAGRKFGDNAVIATLLVGEYGSNDGKELGSGKGCANGNWKLAPAFARPVLKRVLAKGAASMERSAV
jgi:hypothetical protein